MILFLNSLFISYVRVFGEESAILKSMIEEIFRGKQIGVTMFFDFTLTVCVCLRILIEYFLMKNPLSGCRLLTI